MPHARKRVIAKAEQPLSLILDADTTIPNEFLKEAIQKLITTTNKYQAATLMYADAIQDHPPFGASLWITKTLQELYDYQDYVDSYQPTYDRTEDSQGNIYFNIKNPRQCECKYMYSKLQKKELFVFQDLKATHHKLLAT